MALKSRKKRKVQEEKPESQDKGAHEGSHPLNPVRGDLRYEFINDYLLTDEIRAIQETAREFAEGELTKLVDDPRCTQIGHARLRELLDATDAKSVKKDKLEELINERPRQISRLRAFEFDGIDGAFPMDLWDTCAELGFFAIPFPEQYGGLGLGELGNVAFFEELGKYDAGFAASLGVQIGLWAMPIFLDGTEEQKEQYLPASIRGEIKGAFCLTEPAHGSDATHLDTKAVEKDGHFYVTGTKQFITSAPFADYFIVFAVTDPEFQPGRGTTALIIPADAEGIIVGPHEDKLGIRASETASVTFDNVKVPLENILGGDDRRGKGLFTAMRAIDVSRLTLAAGALGGSIMAVNKALEFASGREVAKGLLIKKDNIQQDLAKCIAEIYSMATTVYTIAKTVDDWIERGAPMEGYRSPFTALSAVAKSLAPVKAGEIIKTALLTLGGYGYTEEYDLAKLYRDEVISEIFEGTTFMCQKEIMKWVRDSGEYNLH